MSVVLLRERRLPWLWDLFPVYGGPWSGSMSPERVSVLLWLFLLVSLVLASSGWLLWRGQRAGAYLALALLPVEAVFWWGFALPFPPLAGLARVVLVALAWPGLARPGEDLLPYPNPARRSARAGRIVAMDITDTEACYRGQ